jgi:hypothetical protein
MLREMSGTDEPLSVLVLTDTSEIGACMEQAVRVLGHKAECHHYSGVAEVENVVGSRAWDVVVIDGCERLDAHKIPLITVSPMTLRLRSADGRAVIVASGTPDIDVSRDAEWTLMIALSRVLRRAL